MPIPSPAANCTKECSDDYKKDKKTHKNLEKNITDVEDKIIIWPEYPKKLHESLTRGKLKGTRHARVTENLRIFYVIEDQNAIFMRIMTKNEFEKLS